MSSVAGGCSLNALFARTALYCRRRRLIKVRYSVSLKNVSRAIGTSFSSPLNGYIESFNG